MEGSGPASRRELPPMLRLGLEMGPLVLFFILNKQYGIFFATGVFVMTTLVSLGAYYAMTRKVPMMLLVSGFVVTVFGGLTIYLQDETFIKVKPTIVNTLFGVVLLGGLLRGKALLSYVMGPVLPLTPEGWKKMTLRWGLFFLFLACVNELVWRTQSTDFWVGFKVWGIMPITMIFALAQAPLIQRYAAVPENAPETAPEQALPEKD